MQSGFRKKVAAASESLTSPRPVHRSVRPPTTWWTRCGRWRRCWRSTRRRTSRVCARSGRRWALCTTAPWPSLRPAVRNYTLCGGLSGCRVMEILSSPGTISVTYKEKKSQCQTGINKNSSNSVLRAQTVAIYRFWPPVSAQSAMLLSNTPIKARKKLFTIFNFTSFVPEKWSVHVQTNL